MTEREVVALGWIGSLVGYLVAVEAQLECALLNNKTLDDLIASFAGDLVSEGVLRQDQLDSLLAGVSRLCGAYQDELPTLRLNMSEFAKQWEATRSILTCLPEWPSPVDPDLAGD
ncbi:MAG TPA: hypothetical protein VGN26_10070 [Armatimonadota bacterium]|jgi:hypothetical protein